MNFTYKIVAIVLLFSIQISLLHAQQTPVFANYNYNAVILNPAHAGYFDEMDATLVSTGILNAIDGSPQNTSFSINAPLFSKKVGLAGGISSDQVGVSKALSFFGSFSYKIFFDSEYAAGRWWAYDPNVVSFGITVGGTQYNEDLLSLNIPDDPEFQQNINAFVPNVGIGFLYNKDRINFGISAPNLLRTSLDNKTDQKINLKTAFYSYFGYRFFASQTEDILINPSFLLKYEDGAPLQIDTNVMAIYQNKLEFGVGYRTSETIGLLAGIHVGANFKVLYNYSFALKKFNNINTHGIVLNYRFGKGYGQ